MRKKERNMKLIQDLVFRIGAALFLSTVSAVLAGEIRADGAVTEVTVFQDRAEVTRSVALQLPVGRQEIILSGIPTSINSQSLRVSGSGTQGATILGVELRTIVRKEDVSVERENLQTKLADIQLDVAGLQRRKETLERELSMVASVRIDSLIPDGVGEVVRPRTPREISELLALLGETEKRVTPELRSLAQALTKASAEQLLIQSQLQQIQGPQKTETVIVLAVDAPVASQAKFQIHYQVRGVSWSPVYTLSRARDDQRSQFQISVYGVVQQRTGEDWNAVKLTLSTARPQVRLERPDPEPIFLDVARPVPSARSFAKSVLDDAMEADNGVAAGAPAPERAEGLEFVQQGTRIVGGPVVTLEVPSAVSMKSDGSQEKLFLIEAPLESTLRNVSVPAQGEQVFQEAELKNTSPVPFLPGTITIFSSGELVGERHLELVQPGASFHLPVGLANTLSIERKLLKRFEDDSGIVRSIRRIRHDYLITVKNSSGLASNITVLEAVPTSRNDKITTTISDVSPAFLPTNDAGRLVKREGVLEWQVPLARNESRDIRYSTVVEFPADERVSGLEQLG